MIAKRFFVAALGAILGFAVVGSAGAESNFRPEQWKKLETATQPAKPRDRASSTKQRKAAAEPRKADKDTAQTASVSQVVKAGNNGELRSHGEGKSKLFGSLFGDDNNLLPQTRALDAVLEKQQNGRKFAVKSDFEPQSVAYSGYKRGTIVIDTSKRYLYLVESGGTARRYAIAVGREGLEFKGKATIGDKQEWPRWIPTQDMQKREPKKYGQYKDGMPGGPNNPLGARALYLYEGKTDTHVRIHGTNQPQTVGTNSSNGCFRMINDHVMDLYRRVGIGAPVVVL
ncbi:L,D-transpeptidase [Nitratireductor arenosus]